MVAKKDEHDAMERLSEKDLWVEDLDAFVAEWELQLKEDADYEKSIRNTNRRASRKIGAGKNIKPRIKKDDDYNPKPSKPNPNKGVIKVESKPHQRFLSMFENKPKPKSKAQSFGSDGAEEDALSGLSDDDFDALKASKPSKETNKAPSRAPSDASTNVRSKRAAAAAPKKWVIDDDEESESDDGKLLGDIGDMVKGIGGGDATDNTLANGRVSLYQARPTSSHGPSNSIEHPKIRAKPSRVFDVSDDDQTNYEMLARSSPHKAPAPKDNLDSFLSDDDEPIVNKRAPAKSVAVVPKPAAMKKASKQKPLTSKSVEPKPTALSPAAKAYAAKQSKLKGTSQPKFSDDSDIEMDDSPPPKPAARKKPAAKKRAAISDDEDDTGMSDPPARKEVTRAKPISKKKAVESESEGDDLETHDSSLPKPAARGRPARAAVVAAKKKPIYVISDEDEEDDFDESAMVEEPSEEDDFDESD